MATSTPIYLQNLGLEPVVNNDNLESTEESKDLGEDEESEIDDSEEAEQTQIETIDNSITENESEDEKMDSNIGNENEEKDLSTASNTNGLECDRCGKSFKKKWNLNLHIRVQHDGIKEFSCKHCPKAFGQKVNLKTYVVKSHSKTFDESDFIKLETKI